MAIKIDVKTTEIEFDFAGETVIADASDENIAKMLDLKESDLKERAEAEAEKLNDVDPDDFSGDDYKKVVELTIDLYSEIYEPVFGKDAFDRVYKKVKSIRSTVNAFEDALDHVTEEIEKRNEQHEKKKAQKIAKYKNRKKK